MGHRLNVPCYLVVAAARLDGRGLKSEAMDHQRIGAKDIEVPGSILRTAWVKSHTCGLTDRLVLNFPDIPP